MNWKLEINRIVKKNLSVWKKEEKKNDTEIANAKEGRNEGRNEGRKEGRKEERKEGQMKGVKEST